MTDEHRCFLAIDLNPNLIQKIEEVQKEFKQTNNNVKYVETENLHFTLKFFGNINNKKMEDIKKVINTVLGKIKLLTSHSSSNTNTSSLDSDTKNINDNDHTNHLSTKLTIEGIGTFPNKNYMKVLWIGTKDNAFLTNLQKELDLEFEKLGFKKEKKFKAHLTIGRIKNLKNKEEFIAKIEELKNINIGKTNISKISLKTSKLTPEGPIYSDIEIFNI